jgi:hypothetical protein
VVVHRTRWRPRPARPKRPHPQDRALCRSRRRSCEAARSRSRGPRQPPFRNTAPSCFDRPKPAETLRSISLLGARPAEASEALRSSTPPERPPPKRARPVEQLAERANPPAEPRTARHASRWEYEASRRPAAIAFARHRRSGGPCPLPPPTRCAQRIRREGTPACRTYDRSHTSDRGRPAARRQAAHAAPATHRREDPTRTRPAPPRRPPSGADPTRRPGPPASAGTSKPTHGDGGANTSAPGDSHSKAADSGEPRRQHPTESIRERRDEPCDHEPARRSLELRLPTAHEAWCASTRTCSPPAGTSALPDTRRRRAGRTSTV